MALLGQTKKCGVCGKIFSARWGVSYRQWKKSFWCSRKCYAVSITGKKLSKKHKAKISLSLIGRIVSDVTRQKISLTNTGKKRTPEQLERLSKAHLGIPSPLKGLKFPNRSGEKHWAWIKDRGLIKIGERSFNDPLQKQWSLSIKKRDNWKCRIADKNCKGRLEAHHILDWKNYPELRYEINNGITLCHHHHPTKRVDVEKLSPYFMNMVASLY